MKTKVIATLACLLFTSIISFAQEDTPVEKVHNNELSLNIRQIANVFWGFPAPPVITDPYMVQYRRYIGDIGAIRAGAGLAISIMETTMDTLITPSSSSALDFRLGWQFNEDAGKHFVFYYGADLFLSSNNRKSEYYSRNWGLVQSKTTSLNLGAAPILGVQFYITDRISLSTETSLRIASVKSTNKRTYELMPERDFEEETIGISTVFWPPSALYLNIRF